MGLIMRTHIHRLWGAVPPPRAITTIQTAIYIILASAGYNALTNPPRSIEGAWGHTLTIIWGLCLLTGGATAALAAITGRWFIEKPALLLTATGVLMYGSGITALHYLQPGNRLVQLGFVTVVLAYLIVRLLRIHKYSYEPGR